MTSIMQRAAALLPIWPLSRKKSGTPMSAPPPKHRNILIRLNELPELNAGDVIVSAAINLTRYDEPGTNLGKETDLYPVLSDWSEDTLTWTRYSALNNGNPADKSRVFSLAMSEVQKHCLQLHIR